MSGKYTCPSCGKSWDEIGKWQSLGHECSPPTPQKLETGEMEAFNEEELLAAFAKALGCESATGWTTGQVILRCLREAKAEKEKP